MGKLRLAIVGCGAVTEIHHLPVSIHSDHFAVTALVDKSLPRARRLADKYSVSTVTDDYREIIRQADAAIVALPNCWHAPVTIDLLRQGVHVLVEKPMALKTQECDKMIAASQASAILAVGLDFRFFAASKFVKHALANSLLGNIFSFDIRLGVISRWPFASDFLVRKDSAGGGVLIDFGVHVLDLLIWWLGDYDRLEYYDDAMGGVEADCELRLWLRCGASGIVELSRTRDLRNTCVIRGEHGELEIGMWNPDPLVRLRIKNQDIALHGRVNSKNGIETNWQEVFRRQLDDFAEAVLEHRQPFIPGHEGKRSIKLIEACYDSRQLRKHPWVFPKMPLSVAQHRELTDSLCS